MFVSFEEAEEDLTANVASLGFDLQQMQADGLLAPDHERIEVKSRSRWVSTTLTAR